MQNTAHLLMIEPVNFGYNAETAVNNSFQVLTEENIQHLALIEFNDLAELLKENNVDVTIVKDTEHPHTPDSIFPNNWISFHKDGTVFIYPMYAVNRRKEKKKHIIEMIRSSFHITNIIDLSHYEKNLQFLEGTGSMVLDRENRIAYAAISPRTSTIVLNEFCRINNYTACTFSAKDMNGIDIYHTNVLMCVADKFAVICLESISDKTTKKKITDQLIETGKEIIEISFQQLNNFAGNMLQVRNADNELLLVMSNRAYRSLTSSQIDRLSVFNRLIHSNLQIIESAGGGSARCMIAEIFNKKL